MLNIRPYFDGVRSRWLLFVDGDGGDAAGSGSGGPAPTFVPTEEFKQFQQTITQSFSALNETIAGMRALLANSNAGNAPAPVVHEITRDQFKEALASGDADVVARYNEQEINKRVAAAVGPLQTIGLDSIAGLTREIASGKMPHYQRFKKEVDAVIASLDPVARTKSDAYDIAYQVVVGRHHDELVTEAKEAAIRQASTDSNAASGGGGTPGRAGGSKDNKVPTAAELLGEQAASALASVGRDEESFARSLGYKSWAEYAKVVQEGEAA